MNTEEEPHFLFIITPPYSGSTALAQILNSSHGSAFLQRRAEGQWLVPQMCQGDRWERDKIMPWKSIRAVWTNRIKLIRNLVQDVDFIIEKSPANLVRIDQLVEVFPNHTLVAFNRNPFANCSSILYRQHSPQRLNETKRIQIVNALAKQWLFRSSWVKRWITEWNIPYFNYEDFCSAPSDCISKLTVKLPSLVTTDVHRKIEVKDYKRQRLQDQNRRQISKLSRNEIEAIAEVLHANQKLVEFFHYDMATAHLCTP